MDLNTRNLNDKNLNDPRKISMPTRRSLPALSVLGRAKGDGKGVLAGFRKRNWKGGTG